MNEARQAAEDRGGLGPVVIDAALGAVVATGVLVAAATGFGPGTTVSSRPPDAAMIVLAVLTAAALAARRRLPRVALLAVNALALVWFIADLPGQLILVAPLISCYTLAVHRGWRWAVVGAVITAAVQILGIRLLLGDTVTAAVVPNAVLSAATAGSAGAAVGYYQALLVATRARLTRETQGRQERARRIAAEERLRIAQELHDVLGHTMATISVQAGVGLHVVDRRPEQAREALTAIKSICDTGLVDVKAILGVLRTDTANQPETEPLRAPVAGLDRLTDLLERAEAGGLRVQVEVSGQPRPLPAPVDLAAYRIVQEALTNVLRHAQARTVRLTLEHEPSRLLVRVHDDGATCPGADTSSGHGIDGMRERALALSGRLTAGPHPDGGFEVRAELPVLDSRPHPGDDV